MVSLVKRLAVVKWRPLVVIFAVIAVVSWVNPFGLAGAQHGVFGALLFAVGAWATGALDRSVTAVLLVVAFLVFGETPVLSIVGFAWSDVILLIATSSLLAGLYESLMKAEDELGAPGEYYDAADPLFRCVLIHQFRGHGTIVPTPGPLLNRSLISPVTFPH